jgi:hypothetical protein
MCTVNIKVNEAVLRDVLPELDSTAAINRWAQLIIDQHIDALAKEHALQNDLAPEELYGLTADDLNKVYAADDEETIDLETARAMLHKTIQEEYARP